MIYTRKYICIYKESTLNFRDLRKCGVGLGDSNCTEQEKKAFSEDERKTDTTFSFNCFPI